MRSISSFSAQVKNIQERLHCPIVLMGMMGAGKSSVGQALAQALNLEFFDSDALIEHQESRSIAEIFDQDGESHFRQLEKKVILAHLQKGACILATGGGAPVDGDIREALKKESLSVWLRVEVAILAQRLAHKSDRPLLRGQNPQEFLQKLLNQRQKFYAQADLVFDNPGIWGQEKLENLINLLSETLNTSRFGPCQ